MEYSHVCLNVCVNISLGEKTAKQPQKQNCKQTNCKSFSIFILILSTISSKKHLANLWGGAQDTRCGSQQSEMAKERNGHEIQRYLFCIHRGGENKNGGKNCTFPQSCQIYILTISSNSICDGVCVCV